MDNKKTSFLGTGWDFPPSFDKDLNGVKLISNEEDINSSLEILLSTAVGERIMNPTYGSDLTKLLFEPVDTTLQAYLKDHLNDAILYHEPRIVLEDLKIETDKAIEGKIMIKIEYRIPATNSRYNFVYPFYKTEGTNIVK